MKRNDAQSGLFRGDEALRRVDAELRRRMPVAPLPGLADRVVEATAGELAIRAAEVERLRAALEAELSDALRSEPPAGLAGRVYRATAARVPVRAKGGAGAGGERGGVIGRITRSPAWRGAIAATVAAAVGLGIWLSVPDGADQRPVTEAPVPDPAPVEVAVLVQQLERSLAPTGGAIEAELLELSVALDDLDMMFGGPLLAGGFHHEPTDMLHDELVFLEAEFGFDLDF